MSEEKRSGFRSISKAKRRRFKNVLQKKVDQKVDLNIFKDHVRDFKLEYGGQSDFVGLEDNRVSLFDEAFSNGYGYHRYGDRFYPKKIDTIETDSRQPG